LEYVFAGLLKAELTPKQNVLFRYILRLMLVIPDATLLDMMNFLGEPDPYLNYVKHLSETAQQFFAHDFHRYTNTREEIRWRLHGLTENAAFMRMFSSKRNKLNLGELLQQGAVIFVDTNKAFLREDASALLGRY